MGLWSGREGSQLSTAKAKQHRPDVAVLAESPGPAQLIVWEVQRLGPDLLRIGCHFLVEKGTQCGNTSMKQ